MKENTSLLCLNHTAPITSYEQRKKVLSDFGLRKKLLIRSDHIYCMDFYDAYLDIQQMQIKLPGISLNLYKYWEEGQEIMYKAKSRDGSVTFFTLIVEYVKKDTLNADD